MARQFHIHFRALTTLVLCALFVAGCNATSMQGGGNNKSGEGKSEKSKNERKDDKATELGSDRAVQDEEDEIADRPVPVTGAMLTCASVEIPGGDAENDLFGCVIQRDFKKLDAAQFDAKFSVASMPDRKPVAGATLQAADDISLWHVFIKVPEGSASSYEVTAVVHWDKDGKDVPETLKVQVSKSGKLQALRFGMNREFHLGNNDYGSSGCKPRINTVALFGPLLSIKFNVSADDTKTGFYVTGICGLDYDDVAHIRVRRGNAVIRTVKIKKSDVTVEFGFDSLDAGSYTLELESIEMADSMTKDRDDFIIGDITITSNKPLTGELPSP